MRCPVLSPVASEWTRSGLEPIGAFFAPLSGLLALHSFDHACGVCILWIEFEGFAVVLDRRFVITVGHDRLRQRIPGIGGFGEGLSVQSEHCDGRFEIPCFHLLVAQAVKNVFHKTEIDSCNGK